jgi:hypothetical protein
MSETKYNLKMDFRKWVIEIQSGLSRLGVESDGGIL